MVIGSITETQKLIDASMVGEILTVQEAGGFQMNIAKWDDETLRLWNTPCHTPAYSKE